MSRAFLTSDEDDWTNEYRDWLRELEDEVIVGEFGYEPGEFTVYPEAWASLFAEGLEPRAAWQRALDAHSEARLAKDTRP